MTSPNPLFYTVEQNDKMRAFLDEEEIGKIVAAVCKHQQAIERLKKENELMRKCLERLSDTGVMPTSQRILIVEDCLGKLGEK